MTGATSSAISRGVGSAELDRDRRNVAGDLRGVRCAHLHGDRCDIASDLRGVGDAEPRDHGERRCVVRGGHPGDEEGRGEEERDHNGDCALRAGRGRVWC